LKEEKGLEIEEE